MAVCAPAPFRSAKEISMYLGPIILIVLFLFLLGALPTWPHSRNWGYYPSSGLGLVFLVFVVLMLTIRI